MSDSRLIQIELDAEKKLLQTQIHESIEKNQSIADFLTQYSREEILAIVEKPKKYKFDLSFPERLTAIHLAAMKGNLQALKELHALGANFNIAASGFGFYPIHYAADKNHVEVVEFLIMTVKMDPNIIDSEDTTYTPLKLAVYNGYVALVEKLLACGADPNTTIPWGRGLLDLACEYNTDPNCPYVNKIKILKMLIEKGLNFSKQTDVDYKPALDPVLKVLKSHRDEIKQFLVSLKKPSFSEFATAKPSIAEIAAKLGAFSINTEKDSGEVPTMTSLQASIAQGFVS